MKTKQTMNQIKLIRKSLGLSQTEVAEFVGVKRLTVIKWEQSENPPSYAILAVKQLQAIKSKLAIMEAFDSLMESIK